MGAKRFLFTFGLAGGLACGLVLGLLLGLVHAPPGAGGWTVLLVGTPLLFLAAGWAGWFQWSQRRARVRARVMARLARGDLTASARSEFEGQVEVRRLILALRRALFQVQRVTQNVHVTCDEVGAQARALLETARRQGNAVERSLENVAGMGESLQAAGARVGQLEQFAQETTGVLSEMTERIEQVAQALGTLDAFAFRTSDMVQQMSERLGQVARSGDALARFAAEAEDFVAAVEGGIDAVRRRATETNELALAVTATAERGEAAVQDSVQGMYRVEETVRHAAELVESLGARSVEIGRIVDVIQEVADQTKLLALNAAIIASQAGEHGRAFGVVAEAVRGLAERTARSTRDVGAMVAAVRGAVDTAVDLVKAVREQATHGVQKSDRAADALQEIRAITQRTFAAVAATLSETERLQAQGATVAEASRRVAREAAGVTAAAIEQAGHGRELFRQTQEMARLAQGASHKAQGQARVGRELNSSVQRLTQAIETIRQAQGVLARGDAAISDEVGRVREDARTVIRIGDGLSRTVEQLGREAQSLETEVFRFRLPQPRGGGALRVGVHQSANLRERGTLDPLFSLETQVVELTAAVFSGLVRLEDGALAPELAERWEADPSARRYRFHLRRGVTFHDGAPLTAREVKRHFERLLDPAVKSPDRGVLEDVEGVEAYAGGRAPDVGGIQALDEHTLEVRLREPKAFFLQLLALPATRVARVEPGGRLVGCGPFRLARAGPEAVVLERNPAYWRSGLPLLDRVEARLFDGRPAALAALRAGEVDLVSYLFAESAEAGLEATHQLVGSSTPSTAFLALNLADPAWADARVRRAVRAGLDVQALLERFHPEARPARTLTPPELLGEPALAAAPRPDLAQSERLLREAGARTLRVTLHHPAGRDTTAEDALLFAPLVEAGLVELTQVELPAEDFELRRAQGRLPAYRAGWIADYPDPDNFLHFLLNSSAQTVYPLGYRNAELDRLTAQARVSIDPELRLALYRRAEKLFREDCPLVPLYHDRSWAAASPVVQALHLHQTLPQVRFEHLWVDPDAGD